MAVFLEYGCECSETLYSQLKAIVGVTTIMENAFLFLYASISCEVLLVVQTSYSHYQTLQSRACGDTVPLEAHD